MHVIHIYKYTIHTFSGWIEITRCLLEITRRKHVHDAIQYIGPRAAGGNRGVEHNVVIV